MNHRRDRRHTTAGNNNSAETFLRQIGLTKSQEGEALASCRQHLVSSAADLVLIYKRGELKDLFPQLGLHARIEAQMKQRSVTLAKTCLLDTTASTLSSNISEEDIDADVVKDTRFTDTDFMSHREERDAAESNSEIKLEKLVRDWFERTKRKAIFFINEHRCGR